MSEGPPSHHGQRQPAPPADLAAIVSSNPHQPPRPNNTSHHPRLRSSLAGLGAAGPGVLGSSPGPGAASMSLGKGRVLQESVVGLCGDERCAGVTVVAGASGGGHQTPSRERPARDERQRGASPRRAPARSRDNTTPRRAPARSGDHALVGRSAVGPELRPAAGDSGGGHQTPSRERPVRDERQRGAFPPTSVSEERGLHGSPTSGGHALGLRWRRRSLHGGRGRFGRFLGRGE